MADSQNHIAQWKHNRDFLAQVPPQYSDWLVTVSFYVALHAVDALLAVDKVTRVNSHDARNEVLAKTNRYSAIWKLYRPLFDLSRTVRYLADPVRWVPATTIEKEVIKRYLYPIERAAQGLMKMDLKLSAIVLRPPSPTDSPSSPT